MAVEQPPPSSRSSAEETLAGQPDTPPATTKTEKDNGKSFSGQGRLDRMVSRPSMGMNKVRTDGKIELKQKDCYNELGFGYSTAKKWRILTIIFLVQTSLNFNAGVVASALPGVQEEFGVSPAKSRLLQGLFLISYGLGCELWAPFSEELGRWPILQLSMFLVNIWAIPCALAPNFGTLVVARILGGFSSAGGSVTLGMVADLYEPNVHGNAVAFVVLSSVGGSVLGPIVGGFQGQFLGWRWNFWLQLIFGGATQFLHWFTPETKASVLMTRIARRRRKETGEQVYSPDELKTDRWNIKEIMSIIARPFVMFVTEPIVLCLSLLSGFADALIFTFLESYGDVYGQWGFNKWEAGLAFVPLLMGYLIAYGIFLISVRWIEPKIKDDPDAIPPETRLYWLLWTAPLLPIGLFGFAWTSIGPEYGIPWIAPMLFSALIGIANFAIYGSTIDYMIHAYGAYSASATGGNGLSRDALAGIATFYAAPLYSNLGQRFHLAWASTLLGCLSALLVICVPVIYFKGPTLRKKSKFAQSLSEERKDGGYTGPSGEKKMERTHH